MTYHGEIGQSFARVHRPVLFGSGELAEVVRMVRFSAASAGPWYLLWPCAWLELW
jgi:hypothetical protein